MSRPKSNKAQLILAFCALLTLCFSIFVYFFNGDTKDNKEEKEINIDGNNNIIGNNNEIYLQDNSPKEIDYRSLTSENVFELAGKVTGRSLDEEFVTFIDEPNSNPYFSVIYSNDDDNEKDVFECYKYDSKKWVIHFTDTIPSKYFKTKRTCRLYSYLNEVKEFKEDDKLKCVIYSGCMQYSCGTSLGFYTYYPDINKGYIIKADRGGLVHIPNGLGYGNERRHQLQYAFMEIQDGFSSLVYELFSGFPKQYISITKGFYTHGYYPNYIPLIKKKYVLKYASHLKKETGIEFDEIVGIHLGDFRRNRNSQFGFQLVKYKQGLLSKSSEIERFYFVMVEYGKNNKITNFFESNDKGYENIKGSEIIIVREIVDDEVYIEFIGLTKQNDKISFNCHLFTLSKSKFIKVNNREIAEEILLTYFPNAENVIF